MKALVTGNLGFIGSHLTLELLKKGYQVIGIDSFEEQANPKYLLDEILKMHVLGSVKPSFKQFRQWIEHGQDLIMGEAPDVIFHLAAESHVDNCQAFPEVTTLTNVTGTLNVLEAARKISKVKKITVIHVSTDEVFGELKDGESPFSLATNYKPRSVYAATKASADHLARAYGISYGMDVRVTNCSNNFGPNQHVEKLIPRVVRLISSSQAVTVNGKGNQIRDWLFVRDHAKGLIKAFEQGKPNCTYLFGGSHELSNLDMISEIHRSMNRVLNHKYELNLEYVNNRPHDDFRYAINWSSAQQDLLWEPCTYGMEKEIFEGLLDETVKWCFENFNKPCSRENALHTLMKGSF